MRIAKPIGLVVVAVALALVVAGPVGAGEVQGKIKAVDPTGRIVTIDNGTQLTIPATARAGRTALMPGADVKASYQEKNGEKVVTNIEVHSAAK